MPSRYEREIEELLRKIDHFPRRKRWHERMLDRLSERTRGYWAVWGRELSHFGTGKMLLAALVLFLLAFWFRTNRDLATILVVAALGIFVYAYVSTFTSRRYPHVEKRWRGQSMEAPRQPILPWAEWKRKWRIWWMTRHWRRRGW